MNTKTLAALAALLSIALIGCGNNSTASESTPGSTTTTGSNSAPATTTALTLDEYNAKLTETNQKIQGLSTTMLGQIQTAKQANNKADAQKAVDTFISDSTKALGEFEAVTPPADASQFHQTMIEWNKKILDATRKMVEATTKEDQAAVKTATTDLQNLVQPMTEDLKKAAEAGGFDVSKLETEGKLVKKA